mmetsp:Transcript_22051/g.34217  ORF Transcript_22051/g.34217 Transcript_22051/m.34217 type:complete len:111 (-) Transcript_22051:698-1030(-)
MDTLKVKEKVQAELDKANSEDEISDSSVFGAKGKNLLQEYQAEIKALKDGEDLKKQEILKLQTECEQLVKTSGQDQKVLEKQASEIEKLKRNVAKLQKENSQLQIDNRNL